MKSQCIIGQYNTHECMKVLDRLFSVQVYCNRKMFGSPLWSCYWLLSINGGCV